jgi:hypothetical protein
VSLICGLKGTSLVNSLLITTNEYSRTPASVDLVSAVSVIRSLPPENVKWKIPEINDS